MKKIRILLTALAVPFCLSAVSALPAGALEAATHEEYLEQRAALTEFPDPDASYTTLSQDGLTFRLYDEYAVLAECTDRTVTEVTIPEEVGGLPVSGSTGTPFGYCRSLTAITLPDTFEHFDWLDLCCTTVKALGSTEEPVPTVASVRVSDTNPHFREEDGILYSKDGSVLIGCPPALELRELALPEEVRTIGDYAFATNLTLERAVIPESVAHIHNAAFAFCPALEYAELPSGMTAVTGELFYGCTALSEVVWRGRITTIGYGAFDQCTALTDFVIPDSVTRIGQYAFEEAGCTRTQDGVQYVGAWAVGSDSDVQRAVLPEGTLGIADMAFFGRTSVTELDIPHSVQYPGYLTYAALLSEQTGIIRCRSHVLPENMLAAGRNATDIYLYDPACEIFDSEKTLPAQYRYTAPASSEDPFALPETVTGDIVIHGYPGSTAQAYAAQYGRPFEPIAYLAGDVNGDEAVRLTDAVALQKWLVRCPSSSLFLGQAADVCADGRLDVRDLTVLKQMLLQ
ncbi:MAG: leucine-rich repeat protein [Oscillospiraceae bacterium]|nr:leucine-rich repeat protein [Oscillospiraceae bacterium]